MEKPALEFTLAFMWRNSKYTNYDAGGDGGVFDGGSGNDNDDYYDGGGGDDDNDNDDDDDDYDDESDHHYHQHRLADTQEHTHLFSHWGIYGLWSQNDPADVKLYMYTTVQDNST